MYLMVLWHSSSPNSWVYQCHPFPLVSLTVPLTSTRTNFLVVATKPCMIVFCYVSPVRGFVQRVMEIKSC